MGDVVKMQVFLVHDARAPMDFKAFMEGYTQFFGGAQPNLPARSVIGVASLANPGFLVEIEVVAAKDRNSVTCQMRLPGTDAVEFSASDFWWRQPVHCCAVCGAPCSPACILERRGRRR